jgi:hypothetical protein
VGTDGVEGSSKPKRSCCGGWNCGADLVGDWVALWKSENPNSSLLVVLPVDVNSAPAQSSSLDEDAAGKLAGREDVEVVCCSVVCGEVLGNEMVEVGGGEVEVGKPGKTIVGGCWKELDLVRAGTIGDWEAWRGVDGRRAGDDWRGADWVGCGRRGFDWEGGYTGVDWFIEARAGWRGVEGGDMCCPVAARIPCWKVVAVVIEGVALGEGIWTGEGIIPGDWLGVPEVGVNPPWGVAEEVGGKKKLPAFTVGAPYPYTPGRGCAGYP